VIEVLDSEDDMIEIKDSEDVLWWESVQAVPETPWKKSTKSLESEQGARRREPLTTTRVCVQQVMGKFPQVCNSQ